MSRSRAFRTLQMHVERQSVFVDESTNLLSLQALNARLVRLFAKNDEGTSVFVVSHVHFVDCVEVVGLG